MMTSLKRCALAIGIAGATTLSGVASTVAAPAFSPATGLKAAVSDGVVDVRWRHGGAVAAGVAAGALAGVAIGAATAPGYMYGYPAYGAYGYPGYGAYSYYAAPVYVSPYAYPYQSCGFYGGYGRWDYSTC